MTAAYEFREYRPGDELELVTLFNLVFRRDPTGPPPRTLAEWRWQFLASPGGWRLWVALQDGRIVAQSAGIGYRARCDGLDGSISQSVDSLVHPAHRSGLKQPGLFVRTVLPYITAYGGARDLVFFGWPNRAAFRIGRRFLGYELVRRQRLLGREPGHGSSALPDGVRLGPQQLGELDALWRRCARHFGAAVIRDEAFLDWRFGQCPSRRYQLLSVADSSGATTGLVVTSAASWPLSRSLVIADWLVPEDDPGAGALLFEAVLAQARSLRVDAVVALFPPWSAWANRFESAGFAAGRDELLLTSRSHDPRFGVEWLREHWWYQLAESDYL